MGANLKLTQKGAILVAVPLFFELVFVLLLVVLLQQAEAEVREQTRFRSIIYQADDLSKLFHEANLTLLGYSITRSPQFYDRFDEIIGKIPKELDSLKSLTKENERDRSDLSKLFADAQKEQEVLSNARKYIAESSGDIAGFSSRHMFGAIATSTNQIESKLNQFISEQEKGQRELLLKQTDARTQLTWLIGAGVVLNILVSFALAVFFVRGIGRRVAILRDNSYRLAAGQKLRAPALGDDEISELDGVFHKMARSLQEAAQRERAVFDNTMDVICSIDQNSRFATVSPACLRVLGFEPEELIGTRYFELICPDDVATAKEAMQKIRAGTSDSECETVFETKLLRKDGSSIDVLWSACWSNLQQSIFAVMHDITERKEAEQMKQEVVGMVSHDLRSPLTTIRHVLEMLEDGMLGDLSTEAARMVKMADSRAAVMISLINDLLDMEKGKAGMLELDLQETSLSQIFEDSLQTVMGLAAERKVTIQVKPTNLVIIADQERLTRAIVNLLSNALKYSSQNGTVSLIASNSDKNLFIEVTDHGRGIPAHKIGTVFDRFKQVESADSREKQGTGLGLTICKTLIELHGGTIEVESELGKGSTFRCILPAKSICKC